MKPEDINLKTITMKLIDAQEKWEETQLKLPPLELKYQSRLDELVLSSQRASQPQREAEARQVIMGEQIYSDYWTARVDARMADRRLDTYKVISSNLRNLAFSET